MKDIFNISQLIIKKRLKALTDKDKAHLESLQKKYLFTKELNFEELVDKVSSYSEINKAKAWENTINKYQELNTKKVLSLLSRPWHKYAAAAIVIGVLSSAYFYYTGMFRMINEEIKPAIVETNVIEPGTDKATLTLEDGSNIILEKGTSIMTKNANSDGEKIIYQTEHHKNKKLVYNYLTIPRGGQYYIKLSDGTRIWLNSETQLKYPVEFISGIDREVELVYGEAYFDVSPSTLHGGAKFKVLNKFQEIEVIGTEFNIKAYRDESNIYTTLVEGEVALKFGSISQSLKPSEQSNLNSINNELNIAVVDVYSQVSWKDGIFSFSGKPLKEIVKTLERWYDVEFIFENQDAMDKRFNGSLKRSVKITAILDIVKNYKIIDNYEINNKTIILK